MVKLWQRRQGPLQELQERVSVPFSTQNFVECWYSVDERPNSIVLYLDRPRTSLLHHPCTIPKVRLCFKMSKSQLNVFFILWRDVKCGTVQCSKTANRFPIPGDNKGAKTVWHYVWVNGKQIAISCRWVQCNFLFVFSFGECSVLWRMFSTLEKGDIISRVVGYYQHCGRISSLM